MKVIGIIAEYNPFHLGHLYQINELKKLYPDSLIITIISTHFTERGDISLINKWDKTRLALTYGADLVVELPTLYATQAADIFAEIALKILNELKINILAFGSECNNIDLITKLAKAELNPEYDKLVKEYLDSGINYPTAMSKALKNIAGDTLDKPNDLLGLSYIKEILKNNYDITPICIKRTNNYHDKKINSNIIPASLIRDLYINNKDIKKFVPKETNKYLNKITLDDAFSYLKYKIITDKEHLNEYLDVDEGIENRLIKVIYESNDWHTLINKIKTKRYTYNKINRMLIHILLSVKKSDNIKEPYLRVLGFNLRGRTYLNQIKKHLKMPFITKYLPSINKATNIELKGTEVYALLTNNNYLIKMEYQNKPIIYK